MPAVAIIGAIAIDAIAAGGIISAGLTTMTAFTAIAAVGATVGAIGVIARDKGLQQAGMIIGAVGAVGGLAVGAGLIGNTTIASFGSSSASAVGAAGVGAGGATAEQIASEIPGGAPVDIINSFSQSSEQALSQIPGTVGANPSLLASNTATVAAPSELTAPVGDASKGFFMNASSAAPVTPNADQIASQIPGGTPSTAPATGTAAIDAAPPNAGTFDPNLITPQKFGSYPGQLWPQALRRGFGT